LHPENASALVTYGIYRLSRNPMYCGMAALLLAWAAYLQSPLSVLGIAVFVLYITQFQIKPEERTLEKLFGDAFLRYKSSVRRWL
jgi:protein-S-isoprenylcysteine O-methyltransferase Ste14